MFLFARDINCFAATDAYVAFCQIFGNAVDTTITISYLLNTYRCCIFVVKRRIS